MKRAIRSIAAMLVMLCIAFFVGCASFQVTTDYDPSAQFSNLKTYAWLPDQGPHSRDLRFSNDLVDARTRDAIERALAQRGFDEAPTSNADFFVTYYIGLETRLDVQTIHRNHRYSHVRGWSGGFTTQTFVTEYERGTLLIDVLEPSERRLMWRGSTNARLRSRPDPAARAERVDDAVQAIMERFPPE